MKAQPTPTPQPPPNPAPEPLKVGDRVRRKIGRTKDDSVGTVLCIYAMPTDKGIVMRCLVDWLRFESCVNLNSVARIDTDECRHKYVLGTCYFCHAAEPKPD